MNKLKYKVLLLLIMVVNWGSIQAQNNYGNEKFSLTKIWSLLETNNREIKLAELAVKDAYSSVQLAKDKLLPSADITGSGAVRTKMPVFTNGLFSQPNYVPVSKFGYNFGYSLDLNLYNGGKDMRNIAAQKESLLKEENQKEFIRNNIRYTAAVIYYELYKFLQFRDFLRTEISSEKKQLETIESFYRNGVVLKSDVLRSSVKLSQLELNRSEVEKKIAVAAQRLNNLIGQPEHENVEIYYQDSLESEITGMQASYQEYVSLAMDSSPEILVLKNNIKLSELNIKQFQSDILPKISLFSTYGFTYPQASFYPYSRDIWGFGQTGVKLSLSLDNFYKTKHTVAKAKTQYSVENERLGIKREALLLEIKDAFLQYEQAIVSVKVADQTITQNTEAVRVIRNSYLNQESLLTDLLEAENALLQAKFSMTTAKVELKLSHLRLLARVGIL